MGYTHIELMPITEHPFDGSWGYQTIGYYAVTSRYGTPADFMYFVDHCHQNGIGVFSTGCPAHFPKDAHGLDYFDGTHLYEHADPRKGEHPDWGTLIFNYGRNEVRNFLLSNALFWLDKYHIDGLRVDAVASHALPRLLRARRASGCPTSTAARENLEAIDFLKQFNELAHLRTPGVLTMAEDSTAWPMVTRPTYLGGLGFDLKWNMGWMNDMLKYMKHDPIYRRYHHDQLTFSLMYAFTENFLLPLSHDEVVHLKKSRCWTRCPATAGRSSQRAPAVRLQVDPPRQEAALHGRGIRPVERMERGHSLDWHELEHESHRGLNNFVRDMAHLYKDEPALHAIDNSWDGFQWVNANDSENSILSFLRRGSHAEGDTPDEMVVICNFTPVPRYNYHIAVPHAGYYREVLNSDAEAYWGSNVGNAGGVWAHENQWGESGWELAVTVPPLAILILKPDPMPTEPPEAEASEQAVVPAEAVIGLEDIDAETPLLEAEDAASDKP